MTALNFNVGDRLSVADFNPDKLSFTADDFRRQRARAASKFSTEDEASEFLRSWLKARGFSFAEQVWTGSGRIDFCLLQDGKPHVGIEVKRDIDDETNASTLADYYEQANGYSRDLNVPVLLGPAMTRLYGQDLHLGGAQLKALCALAIFGGRTNVGVAAFTPSGAVTFVLRGQIGYSLSRFGDSKYKESVFRMVRSVNSAKVRG